MKAAAEFCDLTIRGIMVGLGWTSYGETSIGGYLLREAKPLNFQNEKQERESAVAVEHREYIGVQRSVR